jgi:hypothetical protein
VSIVVPLQRYKSMTLDTYQTLVAMLWYTSLVFFFILAKITRRKTKHVTDRIADEELNNVGVSLKHTIFNKN